ncbi:oxidoreductase [Paenibacillus sp. J23TS9]|uniref:Gfo/Idh/MocA family protein n=1 Tax=Paenibacillus sp. J23TS9 TaxID=2807193 RepID=UPI001B2B0367|nr:Gfo/Idh/MocA family oxidoreductase [Paenibacillus sp. J23TS9]GIP27912.1 oxidoreductase [Paenibacillus sp. J23TS9]
MKQVTVALIGAGLRGGIYTGYAKHFPMDLKVVAVADPDPVRREQIMKDHGIPEENSFTDWNKLLAVPPVADAVLICTQDRMHFEPTMKALEAGYHVMLEKPMSPSLEECIQMKDQADRYGRVLTICHVLRYTVFFQTIRQLLDQGAIGDLMSIQHNENVAYWHQAHSFVRGNWRNSKESNPMILAKSCHDMDILLWLAGDDCISLSSYGHLSHFKAENAPDGAPKRCLDGCPMAEECPYYAPKIYLTDEPTWMDMAVTHHYRSYEAKYEALQTGPYGRCVYHCDNDVVDHQVVSMEFANEVTAVFTMTAFTEECNRTLKLMGTKGEIRGHMEKNEIEWISFGTGKREIIRLGNQGGHIGHGGGDYGLIRDFIRVIRGNGQNEVLTSAAKSVESHMMAFAAERSRLERRTVHLSEMSIIPG